MKKRSRIIYFSIIAFLVISENIGNFYSLMGGLEKTAELMGVPVQDERTRIMILIFLDAAAAIGALLTIWAYRSSSRIRVGQIGVAITTNGLLAYGCYQFWAATYQLGFMPNLHKFIGVFYGALGIAAWYIGSDLRKRKI
jgi:hypothetical protein